MDGMLAETSSPDLTEHHIVHADEVDQTGADIGSVSEEQLLREFEEEELQAAKRRKERRHGIIDGTYRGDGDEDEDVDDGAGGVIPHRQQPPQRPELRRDSASAPAPPLPLPPIKPPPAAPVVEQAPSSPTDSLSLAELRRYVQERQGSEQQPAYDFEYADSQPFAEEINEWFHYSEHDCDMLLDSKDAFHTKWQAFCTGAGIAGDEASWLAVEQKDRTSFVELNVKSLRRAADLSSRVETLGALCYIVAGAWCWTAAASEPSTHPHSDGSVRREGLEQLRERQVSWMERGVKMVAAIDGLQAVHACVHANVVSRTEVLQPRSEVGRTEEEAIAHAIAKDKELTLGLTTLYIAMEMARKLQPSSPDTGSGTDGDALRTAFQQLQPSLLVFLVETIASLRWQEAAYLPLQRLLLLLWKSILLFWGGTDVLARLKASLEPDQSITGDNNADDRPHYPLLRTSPLDYQHFRQEVTSKYPAYNPPPPPVPFEMEHTSLLPPMQPHVTGTTDNPLGSSGLAVPTHPTRASGARSILHQSVHIATPAPSPPPSPMGSNGKVAKKQNYQTSPHFPFMYPPIEGSGVLSLPQEIDTDVQRGSKSGAGQRQSSSGKDWRDLDVPASIVEAGQILSTRLRMTRASRQLWDERERFMRFERGWNVDDTESEFELDSTEDVSERGYEGDGADYGRRRRRSGQSKKAVQSEDSWVQATLDAVEDFYTRTLPHLQSLVVVLLKELLAAIAQTAAAQEKSEWFLQPDDMSVEELSAARARDITTKAISGILILLLKWLKRSHVLKFEYLTQLLLDSNYLPLILKMFLHQDVDQSVSHVLDREELSFFHFCAFHSFQPPPKTSEVSVRSLSDDMRNLALGNGSDDGSDPACADDGGNGDVAAPMLPTGLRRGLTQLRLPLRQNARGKQPAGPGPRGTADGGIPRPEVDELGRPLTDTPPSSSAVASPPPSAGAAATGAAPAPAPCSFRNFFSAINFLRVMQKITKKKAHRCLLLVQYKSSAILRKGMKIPDPHLRLYTLKLFKSQVPYSSRKWRQGHMKIITAIYLYCRPELRDDWLTGGGVDAEVEQSLPMEQAIRGLTHWWHMRRYRDMLAVEPGSVLADERDFFVRELERVQLEWGAGGGGLCDEVLEQERNV
ncbi:Factor arrest protein 11 [Ascosphaera acerosa]|nr:Factor arrest protein 11 [Ascosphaera acerosa]